MTRDVTRHDRLIGAVCAVVCPAISGAFLGLVAVLSVYPSGGNHALEVGTIVGVAAFVANAFAIGLTALAADGGRGRRRATRGFATPAVSGLDRRVN